MDKQANNIYPFCTIGIDLGATKIASGLLCYETKGKAPEIVNEERVLTQVAKGRDVILSNIFKSIQLNIDFHDNSQYSDIPIVGVGIGTAGHINKTTGCVDACTNNLVGWAGTPLIGSITEKFGFDAYAIGDVQAHGYGESKWGVGKDAGSMLMVAAGTGVGGGLFIDGVLFSGWHGYTGEIGHTFCPGAEGKHCSCGKSGHLESVASGWGMENCYLEASGEKITGPEISKRAKKGEKLATEIVQQAGRSLGVCLSNMVSFLDVECVCLSGSVPKSGDIWRQAFDDAYGCCSNSGISLPSISVPELGDKAPIIGASEALIDNKYFPMLKEKGLI